MAVNTISYEGKEQQQIFKCISLVFLVRKASEINISVEMLYAKHSHLSVTMSAVNICP